MKYIYSSILVFCLTLFCAKNLRAQTYVLNNALNGTTVTTCRGTFQSSGGDPYVCNEYSNNEDKTVTFCSADGGPIRVSFIYWSLENNYDFLRVYDGNSTAAPLIGTITGDNDISTLNAPLFFTSTGTCLTFRFTSDGSNPIFGSSNYCGWDAIIGCVPKVCGTNQPAADACSAAPQICDINGYCGNTSGWYTRDNGQIETGGTGSGLFCGSIENNSWVSFIASATTATLNVVSSNCNRSGSGIQAQVFSTTNCSTFTSKSNCFNQNTGSGAFTVTATGLTVGQKYYLMIDGFAGNICDYTVSANTGVQVITLTSTPANRQICLGQTATITVNGAPTGTTYSWTPTSSIVGSTTNATVTVNPTTTTTYNCQITLPNGCGIQNETYTITVNQPKTTILPNRNLCQGQSTVFNGNTITTAGTYRDTLTTTTGCDSFLVLNVIVNQPTTTNLPNRILCQGQSTVFNGNTITTAGTYRDTLTTSTGCDSFLVLNVIVNQPTTTNLPNRILCQGQSTVFNGNTITTAGTYRDTLTTSTGCDSFLVLNVIVNQPTTTNLPNRILCQGQSTVFNGNTITTAGTYRDTLTTTTGCDSFLVLNVIVNPTKTTNLPDRNLCQGQSTVFNGNTITTAGTYRDTLTTSAGCDSFLVLNVIVNPTKTTNLPDRILCQGQSTVFNGNTITTAGTYRDTLTTSTGCDSFLVLNVIVNPTKTTNLPNRILCQGQSTVFNGNTITTAGTYRDTLTTSTGCDSFLVLNIIINQPTTTNLPNRILCQGQSTVFNGNTITTAGTYRDTLTTTTGCDSFLVLNVIVNPTKTTNLPDRNLCQGQSTVFNGNTITTAGTYRDTLTTTTGCDSFLVLNIIINQPTTTNLPNRILCQGQSTVFNGNTITTAGTYRDTLTTSVGCDSFLVLNVIVNPTKTTPLSQQLCTGQSIVFNGNTITTAGSYRDTLTTSLGCDSFLVLTVTVVPFKTTNLPDRNLCTGQSTVFNGNTITTAGTYRDTLTTSAGCDSFLVLNVIVNSTKTTNLPDRNLCTGQSTVFNGNTITTAGIYRDTLTTSVGCDSFLVLNVIVNPTKTTNLPDRNLCTGQSTVFNGNTITTAGTYRDTLATSAGCDSFLVLNVIINPTKTTNLPNRILCQGQSTIFNGNTITTAGTYRDTLATSAGCDSFLVLNVIVNPTKTTPLSQQLCTGQSILFNGNTITSAGTYRDTLTTSAGCDSFLVLTVTVVPFKTTNLPDRNLCTGQSTVFNGNTITTAGTYRDTLTTTAGCDSFLVLNVIVNSSKTTNLPDRNLCNGQSTIFNGNTITTAGTYRDTLQTSAGCDSFLVLNVIVNPTKTTNLPDRNLCQGQSTVFNGNTITTAGTYRDTLTTTTGCDSFLVLNVIVNSAPTTILPDAILCQGQSTVFNGNTITTAGTYRDTLTTTTGCDSFLVLNVIVNSAPTTILPDAILCQGQSTVFNGNTITTAGTYRDTLTTTNGCDSILVLNVIVNSAPTTILPDAILCQGQSTVFNGNTITMAGTYRDTLSTSVGCDSFLVVNVIVNPTPTTNLPDINLCQGQTTLFNGNIISTSGTYFDTLTTTVGCDSFLVLNVIVHSTPTTTLPVTNICQGQSIVFNGNTITTAGTYFDTLSTTIGCDSFLVLNVVVNQPTTTNLPNRNLCQGQSTVFNDNVITTAGTYRDTLTTSSGCDSFLVLNVTISNPITTTITDKTCQGSNYTFNGTQLTQSGVYRDTLTTSLGCDSIIELNLTVDALPIIEAKTDKTSLLPNETAQLDVTTTESLNYVWSPANNVSNSSIKNPTATITESTWFVVSASNSNCTTKDSVLIELTELECSGKSVYIPNAFTPNGDGVNDIFRVRSINLKSMKLVVYDRWGNIVFETTDINVGWDGMYKNKIDLDEVYGYYFIGECSQGGKITLKGNVTLFR